MSDFTTGRKRAIPSKFDDYILEGKEGDFVKNLRQRIENKPSCDKAEIDDVINELASEFQKLETKDDNTLIAELKNLSLSGGSKKMKGGFTGISSYALILYLIADAMKQSIEKTKEIAIDVLQKGVQLLEFLSNKDGCAEQFLYQLLGKKLMDFFKFYLLGLMSMEAVKQNPLILLEKLAMLLPLFAKYGTKGIGMTMVTGVGYLIYHFVNHYSVPLGDGATKKVEELNKLLTSIHEATSEDVVVKVETKVNDLIKDVNDKHAELTAEMTEENKRDFMKQLGNNLTEEITNLKNLVGEFDDTMTMEQLREKINNSKKSDGGKRKRRTQRRKRFSNTKKAKRGKQTKKSSKVKKH